MIVITILKDIQLRKGGHVYTRKVSALKYDANRAKAAKRHQLLYQQGEQYGTVGDCCDYLTHDQLLQLEADGYIHIEDVKPKTRKSPKKTAEEEDALNLRHKNFAENYIAKNFNGVQAAKEAGYQGGTSCLNQTARKILEKPQVQEYLRRRVEGIAADANEVLFLLGAHLRADVADLAECFRKDGGFDLRLAKEKGVSRIIKKLKTRSLGIRRYQTEVELHDSQGAAKILVKVLGLEQQPRENDDQRKHDEEMAQSVREEIDRLVAGGWSEKDARAIVLEAHPEASQWIQ